LSSIINWKSAEVAHGIPTDLLARVAYQESHFRPDIISGATKSSAGAVGIMQLIPRFFPTAGADPTADIGTAAVFIAGLFTRFRDWQVALAAYNWGAGDVHHQWAMDADIFILADMPVETQNYVKQIVADVPVTGALV
jgi:soluble lytic murein transglycosylase-like protein